MNLRKILLEIGGKSIPVIPSANYSGKKDGTWTEKFTGNYVLSDDFLCVHKTYKYISSFKVGVETCVYDDEWSEAFLDSPLHNPGKQDIPNNKIITDYILINNNTPEYVYTMLLPAGYKIKEYGNEYRFIMTDRIKISLIGQMSRIELEKPYQLHPWKGDRRINVFIKKY